MNKTIFNLSLVFALSSYSGCMAADETAKPANDLGKNTSDAMQALGKQADKAGQSFNATVDNMKKEDNSKSVADFEKAVSNTVDMLGQKAKMAGDAITGTVEGAAKNIKMPNSPPPAKEPSKSGGSSSSLSDSLNELDKNVSKSVQNMGNQVNSNLKKPEPAKPNHK